MSRFYDLFCEGSQKCHPGAFIGSYNLLYSNFTHPENELWDAAGLSGFLHIEGGPSRVEQVLATNEVQTVEEQMAQLTAVLQQKEDELAVLR
jgi:hypothetical protein